MPIRREGFSLSGGRIEEFLTQRTQRRRGRKKKGRRIFTTEGNSELHGGHGVKKNLLHFFPIHASLFTMSERTPAKTPQSPTQKMPQASDIVMSGTGSITLGTKEDSMGYCFKDCVVNTAGTIKITIKPVLGYNFVLADWKDATDTITVP